ncbi:NAD(P)/FAD-dependent oxidoreductase [Nocardioides sp. zg-579]|uniref:NAD(P)/FAD-dependent oxidoreductase n=1 Tax=Nocardioides marmotae TaxID=2663857 RepID=A0A6I3JHI7_9ACTN|nr:NAD(P)/FAD-dependent oxidoreductase [Nocardioides marmotae]MCR6033784.1 NAD(P)/FAD-dependent oxidoreductase [Gordonia jinghuaiqii]MTB97442.1 NAD(P)/FAD-dependent oxidoreductase [Nocardioides marmotae]QKE01740.1 NAD(P)/FAD-dependent oxidoreductase [Nocardioides marmotae]
MSPAHQVDVVVLGLGAGGEHVAIKLARAGLSVVGVERDLVGGECPFWGCTPSKLMIRGAHVVAEARHVDELAGYAHVEPDLGPTARRIREANHDWTDDGHSGPLEEAGVRLVRGRGRLDGPGRVLVETPAGPETYVATRGVVLATGTEADAPPVPGLAGTPYWTNREVVHATTAPARLGVLGGGPIGAELAQAFARFGSAVTLLEAGPRILGPEEPEASAAVAAAFMREGIDVRTGVEVERVEHDGGTFRLHLPGADLPGEVVEVDELLVATGRRPNLEGIGLETVGLDPAAGRVPVDERLRAGERLWAVGDVTGEGPFTHVAKYQAVGVVADVLGRDVRPADYRGLTRVTFTDPEVGAVGLTEEQARAAGVEVRVGRADVPRSSRGWMHGPGNEGVVKVLEDAARGVLVGGTVVAPYGGEVMGLLSTAVHAEVPVEVLRGMHFPFPTFQRAIETALRDLDR